MEIRPLAKSDCPHVAQLHCDHLPTSFTGMAGRHLLRLYYESVVAQEGGVGFVATVDGSLQGYVCGVWDGKQLTRHTLRRHLPEMLLWGVLHSVSKPQAFVRRLRPSADDAPVSAVGFELRPIVVEERARGTGIAAELTARLIEEARRRGFDNLFLFADKENIGACRFYRKFGFRETAQIHQAHRTLLRFDLEF